MFPSLFIFCCLCQDSCQNIYLQFFLFSLRLQPLQYNLCISIRIFHSDKWQIFLFLASHCIFLLVSISFLFLACRKYIIFAAKRRLQLELRNRLKLYGFLVAYCNSSNRPPWSLSQSVRHTFLSHSHFTTIWNVSCLNILWYLWISSCEIFSVMKYFPF